jgi:hypothetical protein
MSKPSNEPLLHEDPGISIVRVKGVIQTPTGARMMPWVAVAVLLLGGARAAQGPSLSLAGPEELVYSGKEMKRGGHERGAGRDRSRRV